MECENIVSIWFGCFDTEKDFDEYTAGKYTENGDYVPSEFCNDFFNGNRPYEYDFFECFMREELSDEVNCLLEDCSYDESVIKSLEKAVGETLDEKFNAVIMTYNFEYDGSVMESENVRFIAAVPFAKYD